MKKNPKFFGFVFFSSLLVFCSTFSCCISLESSIKAINTKPGNELEGLENLISLTEQNLKELVSLKNSIFEYQKQQNLFLDHPNNKELLLQTGKAAKTVLETIKEHHLTHVFDAKFISELSLFAKMVKKPTIPKN